MVSFPLFRLQGQNSLHIHQPQPGTAAQGIALGFGGASSHDEDYLPKPENKKSRSDLLATGKYLIPYADNRHSYRLVEDFRKHYPLIKNSLNFKVVYSNIGCESYCRSEDCYFNKKYCATNLIHEQSATGKLILDQQIREEIVLNLYPDQWWAYMKYIDDHCSAISELKQCGEESMAKNSIDSKRVEEAFKKSF